MNDNRTTRLWIIAVLVLLYVVYPLSWGMPHYLIDNYLDELRGPVVVAGPVDTYSVNVAPTV